MSKNISKNKGETKLSNVNKSKVKKTNKNNQPDVSQVAKARNPDFSQMTTVKVSSTHEIGADDIISAMNNVEAYIKNFSIDTLIDTKELLEKKTSDYGPVATVLDLLGELTGYSHANASLGEVAALSRVLTKLVRYMSLRSAKNINFESLTDTTKDLVGECTRLHTICTINQPSNNGE